MPIFEMDGGRARLLQPMQPLASSFTAEVRGLLTEHLAVVLGEPLFPIRSRAVLPDHADGPELLALDAAGNPVLVEAAQVVDDEALIAVMRHAGTAARLTATDLARAYHADPTRFGVDYAAFREQVAFQPSTAERPHPRVVLLCAEVAPETADALGALRAADARVTVLQVGVMRGSDDTRLLDVSPLAQHERARRPVEPTALRLVRAAVAAQDERLEASTAPVPTPPVPAPPAPVPTRVRTHRAPADPTSVDLSFAGDPAAPPSYAPVEPPTPRVEAPPEQLPAPATHGVPSPHGPAQPPDRQWPMPELTTLAKRRQAVTLLVWVRERRGQRFEAMLRADGLIQLPDGSVFADPDVAAGRVAGVDGLVDGWRAWRLGVGGPTLAEAAGR